MQRLLSDFGLKTLKCQEPSSAADVKDNLKQTLDGRYPMLHIS